MVMAMETMIEKRPRRLRRSSAIRALVSEVEVTPRDLVAPLFVIEGRNLRQPIGSMPGVERLSLDLLAEEVEALHLNGVSVVNLFSVVDPLLKDASGREAVRDGNLLQRAVATIKEAVPEVTVMADIALDPFTSHGHDGVVDADGTVLNDETIALLERMAIGVAHAGVDMVAPSDMMDGRVGCLRRALDSAGFVDVAICAYAAKYASAFYGPFRDALGSAPRFGDKRTYQMNPANRREALLECSLDEAEGADMLLIKPALPYLDVVAKVREQSLLPVGAYHVSGEYAMVMAAAERGWVDADALFAESLLAIKRAGADFIFTYAAKAFSFAFAR